jgi:hypothetical protein
MPRSVQRYDIVSSIWSSITGATLGDGVIAGDEIGTNKEEDSFEDGRLRPRLELGGARMLPNMDPRPRSGCPLLVVTDGDEAGRSDDSGGRIDVGLACASPLPSSNPKPGTKLDSGGNCCDEAAGRAAEGSANGTLGAELGSLSRLPKASQ